MTCIKTVYDFIFVERQFRHLDFTQTWRFYLELVKRYILILSTRNVIWTFFLRPPTPPPLRNVTHFFDSAEAPEAMLILQALRLSVVHKGIKVNLGQGQDLIMSIKIYLKKGYSP